MTEVGDTTGRLLVGDRMEIDDGGVEIIGVGWFEGSTVGIILKTSVGDNDGSNVALGNEVVEVVGSRDGVDEGVREGEGKGAAEGASLGFKVGVLLYDSDVLDPDVGCEVGSTVSKLVGPADESIVGSPVGLSEGV